MRSTAQGKTNLLAAASLIPDRYRAGVNAASWAAAAASDQAERNWQAGVAKAAQTGKRKAGINKVGDQGWKQGAINKGAPIIAQRIMDSANKWEANFGAVYQKAQSAWGALPPRTTDFAQNINNRLLPVVKGWKSASGK